jgi:uncharacterized protein YndB with AHSA1/START domain
MESTKAVDPLGTYDRHGDEIEVRFERHYRHPAAKVWSAITDPARLEDWMGPSRVEPHVGGRIELMIGAARPMTGRILVWEPPKVLEFSWNNEDSPNAVIRYELTPEATGTRVIFSHKSMPYVSSALMMPGWHMFLARLGSLLDGAAKGESPQSWRELQGIYVGHYGLKGAHLDHPAGG